MDYEAFKALVREMRQSQKEYFRDRSRDALQRSKAFEKRVDEEIAEAEQQDFANGTDCVRMANGQTLRQGNLFEDQL